MLWGTKEKGTKEATPTPLAAAAEHQAAAKGSSKQPEGSSSTGGSDQKAIEDEPEDAEPRVAGKRASGAVPHPLHPEHEDTAPAISHIDAAVTGQAAAVAGGAAAAAAGAPDGGAAGAAAAAAPAGASRTLRFEVCNGFANQRLSLFYGLLIAKQLKRAAVLPTLILDGTQMTYAPSLASDKGAATAAFEDFYDLVAISEAAAGGGVEVLTQRQFQQRFGGADGAGVDRSAVQLGRMSMLRNISRQFAAYEFHDHLSIDCPLFRIDQRVVAAEAPFAWRVLSALRPAAGMAQHVARYLKHIGDGPFNFVHLRVEDDWKAHCKRWSSFDYESGMIRDNCFNNTMEIDQVLQDRSYNKSLPLYVAAHWPGVNASDAELITSRLESRGFTVVKAPPPLPLPAQRSAENAGADGSSSSGGDDGSGNGNGSGSGRLPREVGALVEWELAMRSERFLGNSVSTFSALIILQRRKADQWAGYYNGGNIPLVAFLPLFSTPWVFTFNSWSHGYEEMLKVAVASAAKQGGMTPHCVFAGNMTAPIVGWMRGRGVRVIHHEPEWAERLTALASTSNIGYSHLFGSNLSVIGTWQRIDLPLVPWIDQFTYVLFTDTDIIFKRPFSFTEFPLPLPRHVGLGPELVNRFPFNAGVMLAHLPGLRATYDLFLDFILTVGKKRGLVFKGYGPGDQGAYNQFYEDEVRYYRLPVRFNSKPYHNKAPRSISDVVIVHFHGPKPRDYLTYLPRRDCGNFFDMCDRGLKNRACFFLRDWVDTLVQDGGGNKTELDAAWELNCRWKIDQLPEEEERERQEQKKRAAAKAREAALPKEQQEVLEKQRLRILEGIKKKERMKEPDEGEDSSTRHEDM